MAEECFPAILHALTPAPLPRGEGFLMNGMLSDGGHRRLLPCEADAGEAAKFEGKLFLVIVDEGEAGIAGGAVGIE